MSWSNQKISRRSTLVGISLLAACGFRPALQNIDQAQLVALRGKIQLPNARNAETFALRNGLVTYFGEPSYPAYSLDVNYESESDKLAITQNAVVTRYRITGKGSFSVRRLSDDVVVLKRPIHRVASYSANSNVFAADQTRSATQERLASAVADDIAVQVIVAVSNAQNVV